MAEKYGIERHISYNNEITRAEHVDGRWRLKTSSRATDTVDFVIAATGVLHHPVMPDIPGLADFKGPKFHSARWGHAVPIHGKRVGIIGTDSTAIQVVPALADRVARLSLFQRTAQWVLPLANPLYSAEEKAMFRESSERLQQSYDFWSQRFVDTFTRAVIGNQDELQKIEDTCRLNLEENVHDPELRRRLTPNYRAACKRLIMSDEFYPAMQKSTVELVTEGIDHIEATGVRTRDGVLHVLDVLVLATGFDGHAVLRPMEVVGEGGRTLSDT